MARITIQIEELNLDLRIRDGRVESNYSEVEVDISPDLLSENLGSDADEFAEVALDDMCDSEIVTYLTRYLTDRDLGHMFDANAEKESEE